MNALVSHSDLNVSLIPTTATSTCQKGVDSDWLVAQYPAELRPLPMYLVVGKLGDGQLGNSNSDYVPLDWRLVVLSHAFSVPRVVMLTSLVVVNVCDLHV